MEILDKPPSPSSGILTDKMGALQGLEQETIRPWVLESSIMSFILWRTSYRILIHSGKRFKMINLNHNQKFTMDSSSIRWRLAHKEDAVDSIGKLISSPRFSDCTNNNRTNKICWKAILILLIWQLLSNSKIIFPFWKEIPVRYFSRKSQPNK